MERIKAALERAKQEQRYAGGLSERRPIASSNRDEHDSDVIHYTQTRTIEIPAHKLREQHIIAGNIDGAFGESYRLLRTQVLQRLQENRWNTLAITSPGSGTGKTLTAINLAIALSMEVHYSVLLVDADLRSPSVHRHLGLQAERGLSDFLTHDAPIAELLLHPKGMDRLVVLPAGKPLDNSSEMLTSPQMTSLVEELRTRYPLRIVLFDLPALLTSSDALAFARHVEALLMVIEEGKTTKEEISRCADLLQGIPLLGSVLNKAHMPATLPKSTRKRAIPERAAKI